MQMLTDIQLCIFDLDGTLTPPRASSREVFSRRFLEGVLETCSALSACGIRFALATNQRATADLFYKRRFEQQLSWLQRFLTLDAVRVAADPVRMKPAPIMLLEIVHELQVPPRRCLFIGDARTDEEAARSAEIPFCHAAAFFGRT